MVPVDRLDRLASEPDALPFAVFFERQADGVVRLTVEGELDLPATTILRNAAVAAIDTQPRSVVLDMWRLTFLDAAGARELYALTTRASRSGVDLSLRGVRGEPRRALELLGIAALLVLEE